MTTSVESVARPLTQLEVIRRHIDSAELGEGHNHAEFETCEECEQAQRSIGYLQATGWQNSILMMREIDRLEKAATSERSRVIAELAEKLENLSTYDHCDTFACKSMMPFRPPKDALAEVAAWLKSQEEGK